MARKAQPVYKFDNAGQLAHSYGSVQELCHLERLNMHHVYAAIKAEKQLNGAFYSFRKDAGRQLSNYQGQAWEKDGIFNIDGWASLFGSKKW